MSRTPPDRDDKGKKKDKDDGWGLWGVLGAAALIGVSWLVSTSDDSSANEVNEEESREGE